MKTISIFLLVLAGSLVSNAQSLIGSSTTINYLFPDTTTISFTSTVTVGSGVELTCPGSGGACGAFALPTTIDLDANSITIDGVAGLTYFTAAFNGLDFTGLNFGSGYVLSGFTLTTDLPGLTAADISFTGNSIECNVEGLSSVKAPYSITLNLSASSAAPEPGTIGLFGLLSVGLGLWRVRSRRNCVAKLL